MNKTADARHWSLYWIFLLLAALFFGPLFVQKKEQPVLKPAPLSATALQDRVTDAPAPLPELRVKTNAPESKNP